jgi:hypothetical protein
MKAINTVAAHRLLLALLAACGTTEVPAGAPEPHPTVDRGEATAPANEGPLAIKPATCADILNAQPTAVDGDYTLYVAGDGNRPWLAYCANMTSSPAEYLPLVATMGDHNFSQYTAGAASPGTNVRTNYIMLRIDPATLAIDIGDQTFTTSSGALRHSNSQPVSSMPFGIAMSCNGQASGLANIDLRGTEFTLASTFQAFGTGGSGGATINPDQQQADLTGGGFCGWTGTPGAPFNPFNATHGWVLQLAYKS